MTAAGKAIECKGAATGLQTMRARRLLVGMLILFVALSGLSGVVAKGMASTKLAPGLSAHAFCHDADVHKDAGKHRHDAGCCILCIVDGDDRAPLREMRLAPAADLRVVITDVAVVRVETGGVRHIGWLSAWSSRAPPAFS